MTLIPKEARPMRDVTTLTGSQILGIPVSEPERLFGRPEMVEPGYKALARLWHPDKGGDADIFAYINILHDQAKHLIGADTWHTPGQLTFKAAGKTYHLHYFKSFDFEMGKAYMSQTRITYVIPKENADLVANAREIIKGIEYPDDETRRVMVRYLPKIVDEYETADSILLMIDKPADLIRMRDLLEYFGGKIDPRHVAWMISRMLHHASFLELVNIAHNDFSLDTLFVCPEHHTVCILGGWWYATKIGKKPIALPQRTINFGPSELITKKKAMLGTDPELARLTGRELLGDTSGIRLTLDPNIPPPIVEWLRISGRGSALQDYTHWREKILSGSYGPRKFVKMEVSEKDIYPSP
jgi:hypothetical protein